MKSAARMTGEERKGSILKAVRKLFSDKGFRGVTCRELATAAGISEALLFRHFPNKEVRWTPLFGQKKAIP